MPLGEKGPAVLWVWVALCLQRSLRELTALGEAEEGGQALWAVLWGHGHSPLWVRTAPAAFAAPLSAWMGCTASILKGTWFYLKTSPSLRRGTWAVHALLLVASLVAAPGAVHLTWERPALGPPRPERPLGGPTLVSRCWAPATPPVLPLSSFSTVKGGRYCPRGIRSRQVGRR